VKRDIGVKSGNRSSIGSTSLTFKNNDVMIPMAALFAMITMTSHCQIALRNNYDL
jgi:hypothetical protein